MTSILATWKYLVPAAVLYPIGSLLWPIIFPTIVLYPWPIPDDKKTKTKKMKEKNTVILAGSFNPPHWGHFAMLQYLAQKHEKVICVVGCNPYKTYDVSPEDRAGLLRTMLSAGNVCDWHANRSADSSNTISTSCSIEVQVVSTYIWRYGKARDCRILYRGIRSWEKDGREERALQILNTWGPLLLGPTWPIPSVYLEGKPEYNHISSSLIRSLLSKHDYDLSHGQDARNNSSAIRNELIKLVPESIVDDTIRLYSRKRQG